MEEDQNNIQEKIFLCDKGLLEAKESLNCFDISIPMLSEKKYAASKGVILYRGKYLVAEQAQRVMEIRCVANNKTIFYGNTFLEDKNFYMVQEIDPVFLAILYLDYARGKRTSEDEGKFMDLDQVSRQFYEKEPNFFTILLSNKRFRRGLDLICDKKEIEINDELKVFYRLNDVLLFKWLDLKSKIIEESMRKHLSHRMTGYDESLEKMQVLDFLYERLPFSIFDNYLVKHLDLTQSEFGKFKQLALAVIKSPFPTPENEKPDNIKNSDKKPAKKKTQPEKPLVKPKGQMEIKNFFTKITKTN